MNSFLQNMPSSTAPELTDEEKLWQLIEKGMFKTQRYIKNNIYASTAHCPRYNALTLNTEINNDSEPSLALYAQLGNSIEAFVADSLKQSNRLVDIQVKPKMHEDDPEIKLSGIIDIIYLNENQRLSILEVKSTSSIATKETPYYKKDGTVGKNKKIGIVDTGPSIGHKTQAEIYAALTGLEVSILYLSRNVIESFGNGIAYYIYTVDTSHQNMMKVVSDLYYAQLCNTENVIPNRPTGYRKSIECKFCDLLDACYKDIPHYDIDLPEHTALRIEAKLRAEKFLSNIPARRQMIIDDLVERDKLRLT